MKTDEELTIEELNKLAADLNEANAAFKNVVKKLGARTVTSDEYKTAKKAYRLFWGCYDHSTNEIRKAIAMPKG